MGKCGKRTNKEEEAVKELLNQLNQAQTVSNTNSAKQAAKIKSYDDDDMTWRTVWYTRDNTFTK